MVIKNIYFAGHLPIFLILLILIGCGDGKKNETSNQEIEQHYINKGATSIEYDYNGQFGIYGIADKASAYDGTTLLADAKSIRIIEKNPGPNQIEIEETHYSPNGTVSYRGILHIRFGGLSGGFIEKEIRISGQKQSQYFNSWPSGG